MKQRAYVETSVVSYLTARASRDVVVLASQQTTREWRHDATTRLELVVSPLVTEEAGAGDPEAAALFVRHLGERFPASSWARRAAEEFPAS